MTLQQMKYIIQIAEQGSISEAAKHLYVTQPSLTAAVKDVEKEFDISIFNRVAKGVSLTSEGTEFLSYVRQIIEQTELLEKRYTNKKQSKQLCSVSTQHYSFAVDAFVNLLSSLDTDEYEFTLRETRTYEIIDDVASFRSEVGILYFNDFNEKVIKKLLKEKHLQFISLFIAQPHVFISSNHPLAKEKSITIAQLESYPCLKFEQGTFNSFYFSEEILSTLAHKKTIHVSDRATLFNLLIGLSGYTICTGILNNDLNGDNIVSVKLDTDEYMNVGMIVNDKVPLSNMAIRYIEKLRELTQS